MRDAILCPVHQTELTCTRCAGILSLRRGESSGARRRFQFLQSHGLLDAGLDWPRFDTVCACTSPLSCQHCVNAAIVGALASEDELTEWMSIIGQEAWG